MGAMTKKSSIVTAGMVPSWCMSGLEAVVGFGGSVLMRTEVFVESLVVDLEGRFRPVQIEAESANVDADVGCGLYGGGAFLGRRRGGLDNILPL